MIPFKLSLEKAKTGRVEINFAARQQAGELDIQICDAGHAVF